MAIGRDGAEPGAVLTDLDLRELEILGRMLDWRYVGFGGRTTGEFLAEAFLRVRGKDGRLHPLRANAAQAAFERRRGAANIVLKARQMGMTTWVAGRFLLKTITRPGTLTLQVAHTQESAEEILGIVHRFVEYLPEVLGRGALKTSRSNVRQIAFPALDSEYRVVSAADRNAGRGLTFQNLHCSEVSRWGAKGSGDAAEVLAGLRAGLAVCGGLGGEGGGRGDSGAGGVGTVCGPELVLESTPNGVGGCFYDEWQRAREVGMVRHFFPWWKEPGYRTAAVEEASLTAEELELMERVRAGVGMEEFEIQGTVLPRTENSRKAGLFVECEREERVCAGARSCSHVSEASHGAAAFHSGLDLGQIGYRRKMRAEQGGMADQEFAESPESCFLLSGDPYFEMEAVERRLRQLGSPLERALNGQMEVYLPSMEGRKYVLGVDPAGGGAGGSGLGAGGDFSVIEVLDLDSGLQCAEYCGRATGLELMELVRDVGWTYNTAYVAVERNNHGHGVLWMLEDRGYREIFRGADGQIGFLTTSVSRPQILARLATAIAEGAEIFMSRGLMVECRSFVRQAGGGVGARSGAHDDRVMAMAIALGARAELLGRRG